MHSWQLEERRHPGDEEETWHLYCDNFGRSKFIAVIHRKSDSDIYQSVIFSNVDKKITSTSLPELKNKVLIAAIFSELKVIQDNILNAKKDITIACSLIDYLQEVVLSDGNSLENKESDITQAEKGDQFQ
jgi:hypothetical protein